MNWLSPVFFFSFWGRRIFIEKVIDNYGCLICLGDPETGWIEYKYKDSRLRVSVPPGGQAFIERGDKKTTVTRTSYGFIAVSVRAA